VTRDKTQLQDYNRRELGNPRRGEFAKYTQRHYPPGGPGTIRPVFLISSQDRTTESE
jgi:hypothetical protein